MSQLAISWRMQLNAMYIVEQGHIETRYSIMYTIIESLIISSIIFMNHYCI